MMIPTAQYISTHCPIKALSIHIHTSISIRTAKNRVLLEVFVFDFK